MFDRFNDGLAAVAASLIFFMMLAVCLEIVMRYFLNRPLVWMTQFTEYGLLFVTFLGAAWLLKNEGHVTVDLVLAILSPRARAVFNVSTSAIGVAICGVLTLYGGMVTWQHFYKGYVEIKIVSIPLAPILFVIPLGSFMLFVQFARRTYRFFKTLKNQEYNPSS